MVDWHELPDYRQFQVKDIKVYGKDISFTLNEYVASRTLSADNYLVIIDASNGGVTLTLPAASSYNERIYTIKKKDSSANKVIIDANSTETIDGEETIELKTQYTYVTIICDGTEWFIIGGEYVKMEDTLEDVLDEQEKHTEVLDKLLYLIARMEKYLEDSVDTEVEKHNVESELKDLEVEVRN